MTTSIMVKKLELVLSTVTRCGMVCIRWLVRRRVAIFLLNALVRSRVPFRDASRLSEVRCHFSSSIISSGGGLTSKISRAILLRQVKTWTSRMLMLLRVNTPAILEMRPGRSLAQIVTLRVLASAERLISQINSESPNCLKSLICSSIEGAGVYRR